MGEGQVLAMSIDAACEHYSQIADEVAAFVVEIAVKKQRGVLQQVRGLFSALVRIVE